MNIVTNPPLLPYAMLVSSRLKHSRLVVLIHDVYPEILKEIQALDSRSTVYKILDKASRLLYQCAERIIVLGRDMHRVIANKCEDHEAKITIIPNWGDINLITPQPLGRTILLKDLDLCGSFVIQYCGNIGRTHGIEDILDAAELLKGNSSIHFLIIGWGAKKQMIRRENV